MTLGKFYQRVTRLPGRRRRTRRVVTVTPRRRTVNAVLVPFATVLAGRGAIEILVTGGSVIIGAGAAAAALAAWLVATMHLASAGRGRFPATMLLVSLTMAIGCAGALRWTALAVDDASRLGLIRGVYVPLLVAGIASVWTAMRGMRDSARPPGKAD